VQGRHQGHRGGTDVGETPAGGNVRYWDDDSALCRTRAWIRVDLALPEIMASRRAPVRHQWPSKLPAIGGDRECA
jgi:hypothetical protein